MDGFKKQTRLILLDIIAETEIIFEIGELYLIYDLIVLIWISGWKDEDK